MGVLYNEGKITTTVLLHLNQELFTEPEAFHGYPANDNFTQLRQTCKAQECQVFWELTGFCPFIPPWLHIVKLQMLRKLPAGVEWSEFHKNNKAWSEIDDLVVSIGSLGLQKRIEKGLFTFPCCSCSALSARLRQAQNCSVFLGKRVLRYTWSTRLVWVFCGYIWTSAKLSHSDTVC